MLPHSVYCMTMQLRLIRSGTCILRWTLFVFSSVVFLNKGEVKAGRRSFKILPIGGGFTSFTGLWFKSRISRCAIHSCKQQNTRQSQLQTTKYKISHSCKQQNTMEIGDGRNSKFKTQHNIKDIKREMKNIHTEPPSKWRGKQ